VYLEVVWETARVKDRRWVWKPPSDLKGKYDESLGVNKEGTIHDKNKKLSFKENLGEGNSGGLKSK
jgi:hypothetical protein